MLQVGAKGGIATAENQDATLVAWRKNAAACRERGGLELGARQVGRCGAGAKVNRIEQVTEFLVALIPLARFTVDVSSQYMM